MRRIDGARQSPSWGKAALRPVAWRIWLTYIRWVDILEALAACTGFQWDAGNSEKNWDLHQVSRGEAEQVFFNRPLIVAGDDRHSQREVRLAALGRSDEGRRLMVVFTLRNGLIRVISVRDQSRTERRTYEKA